MGKKVSTGKCRLCGQVVNKDDMTAHLEACLIDSGGEAQLKKSKGNRARKYLHIAIEGQYLPQYWMHVEISAQARLADLDAFLRDVWLECCGHMSAFTIAKVRYSVSPMAEYREKDMSEKLGKLLAPGMEFFHEYDYGSTTHLSLKVIAERMGKPAIGILRILARNDPLQIECESCGKPATCVCVECIYDDKGWLCDDCIKTHECGEEMSLPVVNSPRVGVCGYSGEGDTY